MYVDRSIPILKELPDHVKEIMEATDKYEEEGKEFEYDLVAEGLEAQLKAAEDCGCISEGEALLMMRRYGWY